jgi:DNA polymerase elongation subunit (family B)
VTSIQSAESGPKTPKILTIDIETAPHLAFVWGLWNENIPLARLIEASEVLCFAAKWRDSKEIMFFSKQEHGKDTMIKEAHNLIDQADYLVHFNGKRFDYPHLCREFLLAQMPPPSPTLQVDLYSVIRSKFKFASNKLDHVVQELGLGEKVHKDVDFELWVGCMNGDPKAWKTMERYNKQDVRITEKLFDTIRPWLGNLINYSLFTGEICCTACGSSNIQKRGPKLRGKSIVQQYACMEANCGAWFSGGPTLAKTEVRGD